MLSPHAIAALLDVSLYKSGLVVSVLTAAILCVGVALGGVRHILLEHFLMDI